MFKFYVIELLENDRISLMILDEDQKSKFLYFSPFSDEKTSFVKHISDTKKEQLKEEIKMLESSFLFMQETAKDKSISKMIQLQKKFNAQYFNLTMNGRTIQKVLINQQYMALKKLQAKQKQENKNAQQKEENSKHQNIQNNQPNDEEIYKSNVAILIYQGESRDDLDDAISYFNKHQLVPIILINSKQLFQQLFNKTYIYKAYKKQFNKYSSSKEHSFFLEETFENKAIAYYFALFKQPDTLQLIRWIYVGILSFIDPEYVVILKSNFKFDFPVTNFFSLFCKEQAIFGIQWYEKLQIEDENLNHLSYYLDIPQSIIDYHSIFKIKQFHNPLQCIYKWSLISNLIPEYYSLLQESQQKNFGALELNSILPKLMLAQPQQLDLLILREPIIIQRLNKFSEIKLIEQFIETRQNIQDQMQNHQLITSDWKIQFNILCQNIFCKFQYIQGYFAISVCFFFAFYSPYQLIYNLLEQSSFYAVLALPIPLCYSFNVFVYILISIIYNSQDKIQIRNKAQRISYNLRYDKSHSIELESFHEKVDIHCQETFQLEKDNVYFEFEYEEKGDTILELELEKPIFMKDKNHECQLEAPLPYLFEVNKLFIGLIGFQKILDFAVFLFTFFNLILSYGKQLWEYSVIYQSIILFFVIFVIFIEWVQKRGNLLIYTFNFSFLTYFWQIQNYNSKKYLPQIQVGRKKQLAQLLLTNSIALYFFIAIESYYNYSGYIFLGILGYLFIISTLSGIQYFLFQKNSQQKIQLNNAYQINENKQPRHQVAVQFNKLNINNYIEIARIFITLNEQKNEIYKAIKNFNEHESQDSQKDNIKQNQIQQQQPHNYQFQQYAPSNMDRQSQKSNIENQNNLQNYEKNNKNIKN
ncbi:unnamed protein product [Paramecium octaurelia]|uniref:Transmembrane protein n=1 Tax=Paramecium octaurelia TaxID=43137 RepID=A0A8S1V090_PAROT|nr:unnamed protein product [Paramecium octaurelia]